jgi:hypothetical protein
MFALKTRATILLVAYWSSIAFSQADPNRIQIENRQPGSHDWQLTRVRVDSSNYRSPWIEGYCSKQSVVAGDEIDLKISTKPAHDFKIEFYRMGYYQGRGARLVKTVDRVTGREQTMPEPGDKNLHECKWETSYTLQVPADWLSGVYLGRLTLLHESEENYWQNYVVFIVRDDRPVDVLFQCSDNTWQAYNPWPSNYSIYTHPNGNQGPWADVSFDRPYSREAQFTSIVNDPLTAGSGEFLPFEFPLAYWLEQQGYDVAYCSNSDMLMADRGLKAKLFLSVGHDEYWDIRQFESVSKMRDDGVNLMFLCGNSVCWVTPFRSSSLEQPNRIIFRGGPYGANNEYATNRQEKNGPFPHHGPDEGLLIGARNVEPVNGGGDWVIRKADHWMFEGTGLKNGDSIPGLVGWEYHGMPADIKGLEVVASGIAWQGGVRPQSWSATIYPGPKNNFVFNAATIFWSQGMSQPPGHILPWSHSSRPHGTDDRVQRITQNLIDRALKAKE